MSKGSLAARVGPCRAAAVSLVFCKVFFFSRRGLGFPQALFARLKANLSFKLAATKTSAQHTLEAFLGCCFARCFFAARLEIDVKQLPLRGGLTQGFLEPNQLSQKALVRQHNRPYASHILQRRHNRPFIFFFLLFLLCCFYLPYIPFFLCPY